MINRCFFLICLFTSFSLLSQQNGQYPSPERSRHTLPPERQRLVPQPGQPVPYEQHPYETHPYELHPYEPHIMDGDLAEFEGGDETEQPLSPYDMFDPEEIARERRGSSFTKANDQASHWMNLIDQGQYASSWLDSGALLRDIVTQDQWAAAMEATRAKLGGVSSRKVTTHQLVQTLPYGSRGNFMIIKYKTSFSQLYGAVETVTLAAEGPLQLWKVIAYKVGKR